ncbi:hypothetical protein JL2886_03016 [Phaeobacter gallaeciensis]|uniref:Uncharacterized protein n=1 Tax=Phaeobacter gallaeciensis TaxID=60890 RepID=A0A1B0ZUS3_9RHOB|nr:MULTISPECIES: hypothetical protein [Phaeobacter]MDF1773788.1 hypothetical protein [Pseudophaeobacter sp. bin_em_oilr2.035]MEE2635084.1 hypothetical protein [Pseudomonadota bacterium]ANP37902.1 hypothetical protein JL2886_03016 [Phaeobacter gallaeciensis]MDE4060649.1 hypothetical protein [Phaeobacter gallaeciensis]MDE4123547.1 hypothetical protein [Phaeobacter gallaeciensis]
MNSIHAPGGLSSAHHAHSAPRQFTPPGQSDQPDRVGPPDHAKAWGWRAKQAAETPAEPPAETTSPKGVNAVLSGSFGEISIRIEDLGGAFDIEVTREDGGLNVATDSGTGGGEIRINFENGEHGGLVALFETNEAGEITVSVSNVSDSDPATEVTVSPLDPATEVTVSPLEVPEEAEPAQVDTSLAETSGADMETVVLGLAAGDPAPTGTGAMSEYDKAKALFS